MTVEERYKKLEATVRERNPAADIRPIRAAFDFARSSHKGQKRRSGEPYIIHPIAVAQIVAEELKLDMESIVAALLHDVVEDTAATSEEVAKKFSPKIAELVDGVTKLTRLPFSDREEVEMENCRKMLIATSQDVRVVLIKIADRLHNMRTMDYQTPEKQKLKSHETMEIYAPIAHRLGMQRIKWELEDLSLKYLDPVAYQEIVDNVEVNRARDEKIMEGTCAEMEELLQGKGFSFTVQSRMKHIYSLYRKMFVQHKTYEEITDLYAFRVIVDSENDNDCYQVLAALHDYYTPIDGRFKDYLGHPKPNGYRSVHTTVMGTYGRPFEVQIRTAKMHEEAEYGVAAHWKYKVNGQGDGTEERYEWIRRLLENQEEADAEDFLGMLKVDLFNDTVFVFTPQGDIRTLPAGATPIDFAYNIHSAVGNQMVGARVNGRIVPLDYELKTGQSVEIMTSQSAKGPSRDWLSIARSSEARSKIRQWIKKEKRPENIVSGRASFEAEMHREGLSMKDVTDPNILPVVLKKARFPSMDDLYASIGCGGTTAQKAVTRFREELQRQKELRIAAEDAEKQETDQEGLIYHREMPEQNQTKSQDKGIVVEGMGNCMVKFARCCTPVPGDSIVGFVTRGFGVSIHRADCPNASEKRRAETPDRWVKVAWTAGGDERYPTSLELLCKDRNNLALDIFSALSGAKVSVQSADMRARGDGLANCHLDITIHDSGQLETVMRKLRNVPSVLNIARPVG